MQMARTRLDLYDNSWFNPGGNSLSRFFWYYVNGLIFSSSLFPMLGLKRVLLRIFGAKIGRGVVIKPSVHIKYPWNLSIGDYAWIGEGVWIDNLVQIEIGTHACISQGAYLFCGNHDYKKVGFDLIVKPIRLEEGAWVGAGAMVCPGVVMHSHSVLAAGSVATKSIEAYTIAQGNPALKVKNRTFESPFRG